MMKRTMGIFVPLMAGAILFGQSDPLISVSTSAQEKESTNTISENTRI